jgi:hypothetical protein
MLILFIFFYNLFTAFFKGSLIEGEARAADERKPLQDPGSSHEECGEGTAAGCNKLSSEGHFFVSPQQDQLDLYWDFQVQELQ